MAKDEDDLEVYPAELYDSSDVKIEMRQSSRREIRLYLRASEADFNLVKFYLSLKDYVEKIEKELGVLENAKGEH